jgi:hypothetical protein
MTNKHRKVWKVISRKPLSGKQTQLKGKTLFLETKPNFSLTGKCFPLTGKCFPLTNFFNGKQTHESLESGFLKTTSRETNMTLDKLSPSYLLSNGLDELKQGHLI